MPDWAHLRQQSIRPGGFGEGRSTIWPEVLHVNGAHNPHLPSGSTEGTSEDTDAPTVHRDERQILLDTDRSFVLYPVVDAVNKDEMKTRLNELIVSVFRRRPRLNYYQGYHDIISVLFLTLPQDIQLLCAEKMSLYRLRDSHLAGLEPVVGLLRVLKKLISLVDPDYAFVLDGNMPLPYYALSNLLTLFSHDVATLPLIQHVFDFLLVRPPITAVYLAAAIVICRKEEVYRLEDAGEAGMLHSLLTSLPEFYEEEEPPPHDEEKTEIKAEALGSIAKPIEVQQVMESKQPLTPSTTKEEPTNTHISKKIEGSTLDEDTLISDKAEQPEEETPDLTSESLPFLFKTSVNPEFLASPTSNDTTLVSDAPTLNVDDIKPDVDHLTDPFDQAGHHRLSVSLTTILSRTDDLYSRFPPSHPDLCLSSIMGPNSVVFTWSETPGLLSESEAEEIVDRPETVVLPYVDPDEQPLKKRKQHVARWRMVMKRLSGRTRMKKSMMLAGAVLVLGVAVGLYRTRTGSSNDLRRGYELWGWAIWIRRLLSGGGGGRSQVALHDL